jgi:hypothetical protein
MHLPCGSATSKILHSAIVMQKTGVERLATTALWLTNATIRIAGWERKCAATVHSPSSRGGPRETDYGVEVLDTTDRGYGVRAMRMFEPHQIIVEYAGEIITQQECERRMKQVYKKDKVNSLSLFAAKLALMPSSVII